MLLVRSLPSVYTSDQTLRADKLTIYSDFLYFISLFFSSEDTILPVAIFTPHSKHRFAGPWRLSLFLLFAPAYVLFLA